MQHAVILAHPRPQSFAGSVATAYAEAVRELGHEVLVRDLYGMGFDPCLRAHEIPGDHGWRAGEDVIAERRAIEHAEVFVFVYPFWFNAPPAILKGYVDRVFSAGFGFEPAASGAIPLLEGRRLVSFTSSGAPDRWVKDTAALETLERQFDSHVAAVCGLTLAGHVHFGGLTAGVTQDWIARMLAEVRATARQIAAAEAAVT